MKIFILFINAQKYFTEKDVGEKSLETLTYKMVYQVSENFNFAMTV